MKAFKAELRIIFGKIWTMVQASICLLIVCFNSEQLVLKNHRNERENGQKNIDLQPCNNSKMHEH